MDTIDIRALRKLAQMIEEERDRRTGNLVTGPAETLEEYKQRLGYIQGLTAARELCERVEVELYGKEAK
jgi:hypothetical protein